MRRLLALADRIDRFTGLLGRAVSWLALIMVLIGAYNAVVRYLGRYLGWNLSSNLYLELQWYLFSVLFLVTAGFALREDAHVRVDVVYGRCSPRTRAWIDLLGGVLLLLPFCALVLWVSWPAVQASWAVREGSPDPGGLPRYPVKFLILVGFGVLALQGVAQVIRDAARLRGALPLPSEPPPRGEAHL